jgi:hypothetical protein
MPDRALTPDRPYTVDLAAQHTPVEPLFSDIQVAKMIDPSGARIKARSIRSEREAGRLVGTKIAGKWLYRQSDITAFLNSARKVAPCLAPTPALDSLSSAKRDGRAQSGTSAGVSAGRSSKGQRLSMPPILGLLANSSKTGSTSAAAPREPAPVIQIRSELPTS